MLTLTATYSPEDNKLRLYASSRLDKALYQRVKDAGFKFAPKQDLFVAPMWTPDREDLLLELCGEIGDEDTSLAERAEARADRFEDYSDKRAADAQAAKNHVDAICEHIPFGQPILVGHHSERRARKDAEKIENGMRRAVKMWDTAQYWERRAAGALRHAKYKELPAVRHRRIKGLEADKRKQERTIAESEKYMKAWQQSPLTIDTAKRIAGFDHINIVEEGKPYGTSIWSALEDGKLTPEQAAEHAIKTHQIRIAHATRWLNHYNNRIAYERAMLDEGGGLKADAFDIMKGGQVMIGGDWFTVIRVTKKNGEIVSVTTNARYVPVRGIEEIKDYRAPTAEEAAKVEEATKIAPLANYPGEGFGHITKAQWDAIYKDYKCTKDIAATATTGRHRVRYVLGCYARPDSTDWNERHRYHPVFITDAKRVDAPVITAPAAAPEAEAAPAEVAQVEAAPVEIAQEEAPAIEQAEIPAAPAAGEQIQMDLLAPQDDPGTKHATAAANLEEDNAQELQTPATIAAPIGQKEDKRAAFDAMREQLRHGVQVVSAPQLFPTPAELADVMAEEAELEPGQDILEPEAGTARILRAIAKKVDLRQVNLTAVEIDRRLHAMLAASFRDVKAKHADFLQCDESLGKFDRILMNPPFSNGQDIAHITHAMKFLKPRGKLVAVCANGPRQHEQLKKLVEQRGGKWRDLPADTFKTSGTGVHTALISLRA